MKINMLELANVKRIKALRLEPKENGLTIVGGKNCAGKTSVLDAIAFALGGENYRPSSLRREGAVGDTYIRIETDDGLIIERKGKNSDLTVTDATGKRAGQTLLNTLISRLAIDLPKFLNANDKEKADILLKILGVGDKLAKIESEIKAKFDTRTMIGREAERKQKAAEDMPWHEDAPEEKLLVFELIAQQSEVLKRNGLREEHRRAYEQNKSELERARRDLAEIQKRIAKLESAVQMAELEDFTLESTAELESQIASFEAINLKVEENAARSARLADAATLNEQYNSLTREIEDLRAERLALLDGANLPLPGLSVQDGVLTLDGKAWDCLSGAQQLIVGTAIASRINPACKFVLADKLEQLDLDTLKEFGSWLEKNNLQCIATRVSTNSDGECSIVIEDGEANAEPGTVVVPKAEPLPRPEDDEY